MMEQTLIQAWKSGDLWLEVEEHLANSSLWEHEIECESGKLVDLA